ncbi:MAG: hypothetical protein CL763_06160 [Chloroflexi bacterium]|nr:hypothetical protein [Chloroflexota bacterium]|tara:strand:- start:265 stop:561 length:297 start_codon:yes stop_codon:yes gene_type:complete
METKNRIEQIKGDMPKMHASQASKVVQQLENVVDKATNVPKVKEIRFVGVEFDYKKVKIGEALVNKALAEGFQPQRDIVTESGLVLIMVKLDEQPCHC